MTAPAWEVIHGDCLDVMRGMADASVDAVVTDPPYGIGGQVVRRGGAAVESLPEWDTLTHEWVPVAARLLADGGTVFAFTDTLAVRETWEAMAGAGLHPRQLFYWLKSNPPPSFRRCFQSAVEVAVWATKGKHEWLGGGATPNAVTRPIEGGARWHPTQKPVELMAQLCRVFAHPGATILDPFAGSGSTGVAAVGLGYRFIGIEREAAYVEIARRRIADAAAQTTLFTGDAA